MPNDQSGARDRDRDMVLNPRQFAFILDQTKGQVTAYVGPNKTSLANTDRPVRLTQAGTFEECRLEDAVQEFPLADEGSYIKLINAAKDDALRHPPAGQATSMTTLNYGRRVNIPGPETFPLWPGQLALVIPGHTLRTNQYVFVRVYNGEEASRNWQKAVVKKAVSATADESVVTAEQPPKLVTGRLLAIKGTDVSFYIPPTGCEVMPDEKGSYVREAVTLERLEFCVLLDENGNKRYVRGPAVVFPDPTETFVRKDGDGKFKAVELNENSGIYVKVIVPYTEGDKSYKEGDELFITGREQMIYFPRPEHSIIRYGSQVVHFATAIPKGEGRYVLDKETGEVGLVFGPRMFLPDPRKQVIVRRSLAQTLVALMYPGNIEAMQYNTLLAQLAAKRKGSDFVTEREAVKGITRGVRRMTKSADPQPPQQIDELQVMSMQASMAPSVSSYATSLGSMAQPMSAGLLDALAAAAPGFDGVVSDVGDEFARSHEYTPPTSVTLDGKFDGAVAMQIWTGYATLLVGKGGSRRVVQGPETALLAYDETPQALELSTGTPKGEKTIRTVYLRVTNNKVSDLVEAITKDMVRVTVRVAYRVNFEGDNPEDWFAVENYVNFLCDHCRSLIRNAVKQVGIEDFNEHAVPIVRDTVLGTITDGKRSGRFFVENNMRVTDVEVLDIGIGDNTIGSMLIKAQHEAVQQAVQVAQQEQGLERIKRIEAVTREALAERARTADKQREIRAATLAEDQKLTLLELANAQARATAERESLIQQVKLDGERKEIELKTESDRIAAEVAAEEKRLVLVKDRLQAETAAVVARQAAITPDLIAALQAFGDKLEIEVLMKHLGAHALLQGKSVAEVAAQLLAGAPGLGTRLTGLLGSVSGGKGNDGDTAKQ